MRLDLDLLHAFVVICDAGSLTAASRRLHRSQSALSEQMHKLEETCGRVLLVRAKAGVSPTPAGERLLAHARQLIGLSEIAYQDVQGVEIAGELRLAITDYFRPAEIVEVLARIRARYPRLRLHVSVRKSALIEEDPEDFDIGISMRLVDGKRQGRAGSDGKILIAREPLIWIAHESFAKAKTARLPLVVLPDTCSMQKAIVRALNRHKVKFDVVLNASGVAGLHMALAAGLGVTCLNASAVPAGAQRYAQEDLPQMGEAEFSILPPRPNEARVVGDVRRLLIEQFA
ncbi:LysR family transcriptional regulator [Bradyrhizobium neotropicale]|uniref:LysR family transcriptional regulator n=1 Tax=Bradyrhizobium neotropicale TaxID=1497615 RepID=A0A176YUL7_9BRAD|nr:LysR family transcriptional regulator [Bradyrhizobium neotropicale]OAF11375.1 LysR family transcriptional regulator [Bradyrhizobium neotropicale]